MRIRPMFKKQDFFARKGAKTQRKKNLLTVKISTIDIDDQVIFWSIVIPSGVFGARNLSWFIAQEGFLGGPRNDKGRVLSKPSPKNSQVKTLCAFAPLREPLSIVMRNRAEVLA